MIPIHKKGAKGDPGNYRPISVLPSLSKILEKAIHQQLIDHLEEQSLLTKYQFGYRPHRSTNLAATLFVANIRREVDRGNLVGAVFIDLCKAFDTLSHSTLLTKLPAYGIVGNELELFTDYLFQRQQVVYLGSSTSDLRPVCTGVPQGSILGPLLFIIFYNDFVDYIHESQVLMYADDSVVYTAGKSVEFIERILSNDLKHIAKYFDENELIINLNKGKTEVMLFGTAEDITTKSTVRCQISGYINK